MGLDCSACLFFLPFPSFFTFLDVHPYPFWEVVATDCMHLSVPPFLFLFFFVYTFLQYCCACKTDSQLHDNGQGQDGGSGFSTAFGLGALDQRDLDDIYCFLFLFPLLLSFIIFFYTDPALPRRRYRFWRLQNFQMF